MSWSLGSTAVCVLFTTQVLSAVSKCMFVDLQARHICRRPLQPAWTCRAIVAPTTHTNGAALGGGKPVLENPLWRDSFQTDSHSTAAQVYRQPKGMLPNRLRLFAGTANPVCKPFQQDYCSSAHMLILGCLSSAFNSLLSVLAGITCQMSYVYLDSFVYRHWRMKLLATLGLTWEASRSSALLTVKSTCKYR